uniref:DUF1573 domain-containing protein n=1 Tax=Caenorhabditis tropicalis TaxID=1561998 RepID=A0A1I7TX16_9PELO
MCDIDLLDATQEMDIERESDGMLATLQAIGVISGKVQEETIQFEVESSSDLPNIPEIPNFVVKSDFQDKETAIVKVGSVIPLNSEIEVLGSYSERVQATFQEDNIILDTVPCLQNQPCEVTFPFTVILILRNGESHREALLTFEEEKTKNTNF